MAGTRCDAAIECVGLTKIFHDFWLRARVTAVSALDLRVDREQVFGLLGPNGSGKSTTIKMILGLLHPSRGRLAVLGLPPSDVAIKRRIGYLPEDSYLYRFLDARELLDYYARLFDIGRRERSRRIDMLLEMVGMDAVQWRPISEYSKGMQRRLGLAQALINDPDLLILDEPTTGLDPLGARQIKDIIRALRERGKTVLLSSHLLGEVEDVCCRVAILYGGRKQVEGTLDELLTRGDRELLETTPLDAPLRQRVAAMLAEQGAQLHRSSAPRQTLESLFVEIVARARAEGATTAGATAGGPLASFLAAADAPRGDVISELVAAGQQAVPGHASTSPDSAALAAPVDRAAIAELLMDAAGSATPPPVAAQDVERTSRDPDAVPRVDQQVIDELLES